MLGLMMENKGTPPPAISKGTPPPAYSKSSRTYLANGNINSALTNGYHNNNRGGYENLPTRITNCGEYVALVDNSDGFTETCSVDYRESSVQYPSPVFYQSMDGGFYHKAVGHHSNITNNSSQTDLQSMSSSGLGNSYTNLLHQSVSNPLIAPHTPQLKRNQRVYQPPTRIRNNGCFEPQTTCPGLMQSYESGLLHHMLRHQLKDAPVQDRTLVYVEPNKPYLEVHHAKQVMLNSDSDKIHSVASATYRTQDNMHTQTESGSQPHAFSSPVASRETKLAKKVILIKTTPEGSPSWESSNPPPDTLRSSIPVWASPSKQLGSSYPFTSVRSQSAKAIDVDESFDTFSVGSSTETPLSAHSGSSAEQTNKKKGILKPLQTIKETLTGSNQKSRDSEERPVFRLARSNSTPDVLDGPDQQPDDDYGFLSFRSFRRKSKNSQKNVSPSSVMQKESTPIAATKETSASGGVKLFKWRKTKQPTVKTTCPWQPEDKCCWTLTGQDGLHIHLKPRSLLELVEVESKTLQKIAHTKLQNMALGCAVTIPKGNGQDRSKSHRFSIKKKSSEKSKDGREKEASSTSSSSSPCVFGIPLLKVIANDQEFRLGDLCLPGRKGSSSSLGESLSSGQTLQDSNSSLDKLDSLWTSSQVPYFLQVCCTHIQTYGLNVEGIFRKGSSKKRVADLKEEFNSGSKVQLSEEHSPHDVACLLKEWLRELPDPLLTKDLFNPFVASQKISDERQRHNALRYLLCLLPQAHRDTLYTLLEFLNVISEHSSPTRDQHGKLQPGNKMNARNLATLFGPNLLHKCASSTSVTDELPQVISVVYELIEHYQELFQLSAELQDDIYRALLETNPHDLDRILRLRSTSDQELLRLGNNKDQANFTTPPANNSPSQTSPSSGGLLRSSTVHSGSPRPRSTHDPSYRYSATSVTPILDLSFSPHSKATSHTTKPKLHVTPGSPLPSQGQPQRHGVQVNSHLLTVSTTSKDALSSNSSLSSSGYHGSSSRSGTASPIPVDPKHTLTGDEFSHQRTSSLKRPLMGLPTNAGTLGGFPTNTTSTHLQNRLPVWQKQRWEHWEQEAKERSQALQEQETLV